MRRFITGDIVVAHEMAKFICCVILSGIVCFKMEISFWILLALNKWGSAKSIFLQPLRHVSLSELARLNSIFHPLNELLLTCEIEKKTKEKLWLAQNYGCGTDKHQLIA